ncbi:MAG: RCC1 domain-containing protein, partial [Pseudoflavonifractor sp.]
RAAAPIYATVAAGEWSATATELNEVSLVAAGGNFSLVMLENGRVMTWGDNTSGQLGLAAAGTGKAGAETVDDLKGVPYYAGEHEAEILEISFSGGTVTSRTDTSLTGVTLKYDPNLSNSTTILDTAKRYSHFGFNL